MQSGHDGKSVLPAKASEAVIRALRHEVGDLLQTIYAAAAILNQRLPAGWDLERRVIADMKSRGDECRKYLDFAMDLLSPPPMGNERLLVTKCLAGVIETTGLKHPSIQLHQEIEPNLALWCDVKKMELAFQLLFSHAFATAGTKVRISARAGKETGSVEAALDYNLNNDFAKSLHDDANMDLGIARATTNARSRLSLLLAERVIRLHGGKIDIGSSEQGDCRIEILIPGGKDPSIVASGKP